EIPLEHQFEAWKQVISPLLDISPMKDTRSFSHSSTSYLVEQLTFSQSTFDKTQFTRTSRHLSSHGSDCMVLHYFRSGVSQGTLESGEQSLMANDIISIQDFAHPFSSIGEATSSFGVVIPRHAIAVHDQMYKNYPIFSWPVNSPAGRVLTQAWLTIWENLPNTSQTDAPLIAQGFIGLLNGLLPNNGNMTTQAQVELATIDAMKAYLQDNLHLPNVGANMLCQVFHCSRATVYRLFKAEGGVHTYVREQRLARCYQALRQLPPSSRKTISEIARQWGFTDAASFSRLFRKQYGMSPSDVEIDLPETVTPVLDKQASYWADSNRVQHWLKNYS
ncbi:MAG: AraC family transcriptional regulator, partial [Cyanobacteria bacterium J06626_26]